MISAWRRAQQKAFELALSATHEMRVEVKLLRLGDGEEVADLTSRLIDGQVNIDADAEVTRSADLTLNDPDHALHLDSRGIGDGGIYLDRLVAIFYGVWVESEGDWFDVPVFTGPVTGMARDGSQLNLTCLGMEFLAMGQTWQPMTFRKGADVSDVITGILAERAGETDFILPRAAKPLVPMPPSIDLPIPVGRLPETLSLGRMTQPWGEAKRLARSVNRQLFYNGRGVCVLRNHPGNTMFTFRDGDGGTVLSDPDVTYDLSSVSNLVWVRGRKAKGKPQVSATAVASRSHPLSPWSLGRSGVPRYLVTEVENDGVRTNAAAKAIADRQLGDVLREGVQVSFDALPVPHLDPLDPVAVNTEDASVSFLLRQASIPLVHSGVMSVGTNKRVTPNRRKVRRR